MSPECAHLYLSVHPHLKVENVKTEGHSGQLVGKDMTVLWKIHSSCRSGKCSGVHCLAWVSCTRIAYLVSTISKESYV